MKDESLAGDIGAIWRSELTAMAVDRELQETMAMTATAMMAMWTRAAAAMLPVRGWGDEYAGGSPIAAKPAGAAPATATSGAGGGAGAGEVEWLRRRVAELERAVAPASDGDASSV